MAVNWQIGKTIINTSLKTKKRPLKVLHRSKSHHGTINHLLTPHPHKRIKIYCDACPMKKEFDKKI